MVAAVTHIIEAQVSVLERRVATAAPAGQPQLERGSWLEHSSHQNFGVAVTRSVVRVVISALAHLRQVRVHLGVS